MKTTQNGLLFTVLLLAFGCQAADPDSNQGLAMDSTSDAGNHSVAASSEAPWINRLWVRNDTDGLPGQLRIFLANGTLVMDSCWETYRLANWETRSDSVVVWHEDTAEIEAHLEMNGPKELQMRLMLVGETLTEQYHEADVPYVCPDMER